MPVASPLVTSRHDASAISIAIGRDTPLSVVRHERGVERRRCRESTDRIFARSCGAIGEGHKSGELARLSSRSGTIEIRTRLFNDTYGPVVPGGTPNTPSVRCGKPYDRRELDPRLASTRRTHIGGSHEFVLFFFFFHHRQRDAITSARRGVMGYFAGWPRDTTVAEHSGRP